MLKEDIAYYIAGLWEGDGHIIVKSEKTRSFVFAITFNNKNVFLAEYLISYIGYGYLRSKVNENAVVLTIANKKGLLRVVNLLNGKLRTPKIAKFNILIDWLNLKYTNINLIKMDIDCSDMLINYWFAGFSEADACFDIRISTKAAKSKIAFRWRLDQRMFDPMTKISNSKFLLLIADTFNTKLKKIDRKHGSYYHISITVIKSLEKMILYFNKFKLLGIKSLDFDLWVKALDIYKNRIRITPQLILELKKIKNQMNSRRTDFYLWHFNK